MARDIDQRAAAAQQAELTAICERGRLREAITYWLENVLDESRSAYTRYMHKCHMRVLVKYFGDCPLNEINYERLRAYIKSEQQRGLCKESLRKRLCTLYAGLREAVNRGLLMSMPPEIKLPTDSRPKHDFWTIEQWRSAHLAAGDDHDLRIWIDLMWWLGSHPSELLVRFRWSDVDLVKGTWIRRNQKSKVQPIALPLPREIGEILWVRKALTTPHARALVAGNALDYQAFMRRLRRLCKRTGLPRVTCNGLRRSCGTHLKGTGMTDNDRALWLGHTPGSMGLWGEGKNQESHLRVLRMHYSEPHPSEIDRMMIAVEAFLPPEPEPAPPAL